MENPRKSRPSVLQSSFRKVSAGKIVPRVAGLGSANYSREFETIGGRKIRETSN
jgi:hypothetical protein